MNQFKQLENLISQTSNKGSRSLILIRHGQTNQNKVGQISGWSDHRLTLKGREQAHSLFQSLYKGIPIFQAIYTSDLIRAKDTCHIALGFPERNIYQQDKRLRELNFGSHENIYYNTLSKEEQQNLNSMDYIAPQGEGWKQVKDRALHFIQENCKQNGTYLIFTHGGLICSLTYELGFTDVISNCSSVGIELQNNSPKSIQFIWEYPQPDNYDI